MTLTTNGLDYIAREFGIGDCWVGSGVSWVSVGHDGSRVSESGGTKHIVGRLINDAVYAQIEMVSPRTGTYMKSQLISANDGQSITLVDVNNADSNYCVGVTPPPPTPTPGGTTETPPFEVVIVEGKPCPAGAPDVLLDTSEAFAYFKAEPLLYVGVMKIDVTNRDLTGNECYAYFAWEMRMWPGPAGTTCPTDLPAHKTISRFLGEVSATKVISVKLLGANEKAMIGGSFEIPTHFRGKYTLCLTLWGNFNKQALLDELLSERGYEEEIPW